MAESRGWEGTSGAPWGWVASPCWSPHTQVNPRKAILAPTAAGQPRPWLHAEDTRVTGHASCACPSPRAGLSLMEGGTSVSGEVERKGSHCQQRSWGRGGPLTPCWVRASSVDRWESHGLPWPRPASDPRAELSDQCCPRELSGTMARFLFFIVNKAGSSYKG